jgi:hypothetical protein
MKHERSECSPEDVSDRKAVLAHGSNQSEWQLQPKRLNHDFGDDPIYVQRVWLPDCDVVYAARITSYGVVPATLHQSQGAKVQLAVTWLAGKQPAAMDESEGLRTNPRKLVPVKFDPDTPMLAGRAQVDAYTAGVGPLTLCSGAIALSAVRAENRNVQQVMTEEQVLEKVRRRLSPRWREIEPNLDPPGTIDDLIRFCSDDFASDGGAKRIISDRRERVNRILRERAVQPD